MKKIDLFEFKKKFRNGQVVAFNCNYVLFKVVKTKKSEYLEFEGVTHEDKPCRCNCCTVGGVSGNCLTIPNTSRNCQQYKDVMKLEKETDKEIRRDKHENNRR